MKREVRGDSGPASRSRGLSRNKFYHAAIAAVGLLALTMAAPAAAQTLAHDEHTLFAGAITGTHEDTWEHDGVTESIQEWKTGGSKNNRTSAAEHHWIFDLPSGSAHTFFVEATLTDSGEGDDWEFLWSTDDQNFTQFLVFQIADSGTYQSAALPSGLSGVVHIAVKDTDRTGGNSAYDTISIDHMYVETSIGGPPTAPSDLAAGSWSSSTVDLTWSDNSSNEDGFRILRSLDGITWDPPITVAANVHAYQDSGLDPSTTFYYIVQAFNTEGASDWSNMASATTFAPSTFTVEQVQPGGTMPSHAFDLYGDPGIGYACNDMLEFAHWNGTGWDIDIVDGIEKYRGVDVAYSPTSGNPGCSYFFSNQISFAEKVGSSWVIERIESKSYWKRHAMAYDPSGNPAVVYDKSASGRAGDGLVIARRIGGEWIKEAVDKEGTDDSGKSIVFDLSGNPAIAYGVDLSGDTWVDALKFARWNGSSWELEIVDSGALFFGNHPELAFDPTTGWPTIVHSGASGPGGDMEARLLRWNGSAWDLDILSPGNAVGLAIDGAGNTHVTYRDIDQVLWYAVWDGATWQRELIDQRSWTGGVIRIDTSGRIGITYEGKLSETRGVMYASN